METKLWDSFLISGPVLLGFANIFDKASGKRGPMPKITPSRIGATLIPFECPHCNEVRSEPLNKRSGYHNNGFSFCPACGGRYILDYKGTPLDKDLVAGSISAPVLINGKSQPVIDKAKVPGFYLLGT